MNNNIKAKKKFGQNFLHDNKVLENIIEVSELDKDTLVIEVGPGLGALTKYLCKYAGHVVCYEIDKDLINPLKVTLSEFNNYEIINEDILNIDLKSEIKRYNKYNKIYFISNLPYYITTPIITKILNEAPFVTRYVMMMQKEVGLRLTGEPKSKDYGAITIMLKYKGDARIMFDVDRKSFTPAPNVDSCVVRFDLYDYKKYNPLDEELLFKLIRASFIQRRKTLVNNLSTVYNKDFINKMLTDNSFSLNVRAEELSIEDFIRLSDYIYKEKK